MFTGSSANFNSVEIFLSCQTRFLKFLNKFWDIREIKSKEMFFYWLTAKFEECDTQCNAINNARQTLKCEMFSMCICLLLMVWVLEEVVMLESELAIRRKQYHNQKANYAANYTNWWSIFWMNISTILLERRRNKRESLK